MSTNHNQKHAYDKCTSNLPSEYTESDIRRMLSALNSGDCGFVSLSLRKMDRLLFDDRIGFANLSRYIRGDPIVNKEHRSILLIKKDRRNRIMINPRDPESAALSILTSKNEIGEYRASNDFVKDLVKLLDIFERKT